MSRFARPLFAIAWLGLVLMLAPAPIAWAQGGIDAQGRPVARVQIEGLDEVPEQLVRNQIRLRPGDPYDQETVEQDITRITHLGRFASVRAAVRVLDDGALALTYQVEEQPLLKDVHVQGNKAIPDATLLSAVGLRAGDPADPTLIAAARANIRDLYEQRGYFVTDVEVDEDVLAQSQVLIFRVREGPKVTIEDLRFSGNEIFTDRQLRSQIQSKEQFLIFRRGELSRDRLTNDVARIRDFYESRGYLDVQVGRQIDLSPDQRRAVVTFLVDEGPRYTVASITVEGNRVFRADQVLEMIPLREGDVFSQDRVRRSREIILNELYGKMGYMQTEVQVRRRFLSDQAKAAVDIVIDEGRPAVVGKTTVTGNEETKASVIYRELRGMQPGRAFDREGVERTELRLRESPLFRNATVTIQGEPNDPIRDVLVEVEEQGTGSLNFGAGVSSDAGLVGAVDVIQRNFDITDVPESFSEFITGRAFRGAGQYFSLSLQPGSEVNRYAVQFREPYLLNTDLFLDTSLFYFNRRRPDYDEGRMGGLIGIGQRLGDVWSVEGQIRAEDIQIDNVDDQAPRDVFDVQGSNVLTSLGLEVTRNTTDSRLFPTQGSVTSMGWAFAGAVGGDFDFTKLSARYHKFWTVDEDFLGRRTVLSLRTELGYIFEDDVPLFERFYAGGHRTLRGFAYRGIGPMQRDEAVGGKFLLLAGLEYNMPLYEDAVRWVVFVDSGTVSRAVSLNQYRVSLGTGLRIQVPFLGRAPFAFDFAVPVRKQDEDETRLFSFDVALPF